MPLNVAALRATTAAMGWVNAAFRHAGASPAIGARLLAGAWGASNEHGHAASASRASLSPLNCQRASVGKKLR
jgi:hypothetical protein